MHRRRDASTSYKRLATAFVASVGVHLLLGLLLTVTIVFDPPPAEPGPTAARSAPIEVLDDVTLERLLNRKRPPQPRADAKKKKPPEKRVPEKKPETAPAQVVHIPPPPREERPVDARLVSEYDSKVEKEMRSRDRRAPTPRTVKAERELISTGDDPNGDARARDVPKRPKVATGATGPGDKRTPSEKPGPDTPADPAEQKLAMTATPELARGSGDFRHNPDQAAERARTPGGGGQVGGSDTPDTVRSLLPTLAFEEVARSDGSIDHLEDIEDGDATFLNTREWKHSWFFNRVKRTVQRRWRAVDRHRRHDPYGRVFGVRDRLTVLDVTISADGQLEDVYVVKDSGVAFLDEAAVQAFREAQPFPNPPPALQDADGNIRFKFGFYLEIHGRGGFRGDFLR